jgi:hypothetical protein
MVRSTGVMAAALVVTLMVATEADAAKWRGKTKQGRGVSVHTGADGLVSFARIRYVAPCGDGLAVRSGVAFLPPFDSVTTTSFFDEGPFRFRAGKERIRAFSTVRGGLRSSGRWTGTFAIRMRVFRGGKLVTTCRLKRVGWRASPA